MTHQRRRVNLEDLPAASDDRADDLLAIDAALDAIFCEAIELRSAEARAEYIARA